MPDTFLGQLASDDRETVLADASILSVRASQGIFGAADAIDYLGVLLDGIARTYLTASDGRRLTVRYARPGDSIGSVTTDGRILGAQAVTDCVILEIDLASLRSRMAGDSRLAELLLAEVARRLDAIYTNLAANTFGSMRERVAHHLLDLATETPDADHVIAPVTQQALADCVGTVREVVARVLRDFRDDGLVATHPGHVELLDRRRLAAVVGRRHHAVVAARPRSTPGRHRSPVTEAPSSV